MMDKEVEITLEKDKDLRFEQWFIRIGKKYWFDGIKVALDLKYPNPNEKIQDHVDSKDKRGYEELLGKNFRKILGRNFSNPGETSHRNSFFQNLEGNQNLISELGLISFCAKSRKPDAVPFLIWVYQTMKKLKETEPYWTRLIENLLIKIKTLERKIEASSKEMGKRVFCDKETQTKKSVVLLDGSFKDLEDKLLKTLKRNRHSIKKAIEEIDIKLERYTRRLSSSSSSFSHHQLYYSSDSD